VAGRYVRMSLSEMIEGKSKDVRTMERSVGGVYTEYISTREFPFPEAAVPSTLLCRHGKPKLIPTLFTSP
jgi:hypothetical protein